MIKRNKKSSIIVMLAAVLLLLPLSGSAQAISRNKKPATTKTTKKKSAASNTTTTKSKQSNSSKHSNGSTRAQNIPAVVQKAMDDMVWVEGGTFTMGSSNKQYSLEGLMHQVTLSGYYISKYEVTQELWQAVMGSNPSNFKGNARRPVEQVSWNKCQEFIKKLNRLTGKRFRLPTEAEWEFAARGGIQSHGYKYSGSNTPDDVSWYEDNSGGTTHPVGQKSPNELGLYDMSGNVDEWCQDWFGDYSSASQTDPIGPNSGSSRVERGGSFNFDESEGLVYWRRMNDPSDAYYRLGLRLAM